MSDGWTKMLIYLRPRNGSSREPARWSGAQAGTEEDRGMPELAISVEKVGFLIEKTREFDVKEAETDPDSGSNPTDDDMIDVLEDDGSDPVAQEISGFINAMTEDEQIDLIALMRLGRGDGSIEDWNDLRREAAEVRGRSTSRTLLGEPLVSDYLAEGLDAFGLSWTGEGTNSA
jgi:hypothetical protein